MINPIKIDSPLLKAIQQRFFETKGLKALMTFALSNTSGEYEIPQKKYDELYDRYIKTNAELDILKNKIYDIYIPADIPRSVEWRIDFEKMIIEIPGYTKKPEGRVDQSTLNYNDVLLSIYNYDPKYFGKRTMEATFQVTEACTLVCKYCYQHNKSPKVMTLDVAKKYIDKIFEAYQETHFCIILDFIGGEPLLQSQLISDIVDYWDYKCIMENLEWGILSRFSICTNGTEYRKEDSQKLISKLGERLSFTVSIDGNKELHDSARIFPNGNGSYDLAIDAAQDFEKRLNVDLGSKMTIAPSNINFLFPAVKHYLSQGKETIFANCVYEEGWTYEHAQLFYKELKKLADYVLEKYPDVFISLFNENDFEPMDPELENRNWCGGNGLMLACDPDGVLYPCLRYMPSSLGDNMKPLTCGHVDTGVDVAILNDMEKITRRSQSTDECFNCPIARGCSWCTAYNYEVFGTINKRATFICPMHKARALANVYYWNKYYQLKGINKVKKNYCPKEWALQIIDENEYEILNSLAFEE